MKVIPIDKRSKKEQKEFYSRQRGTNGFNTGTRDMKSAKYPSRAERKENFQKVLDKECGKYYN